MFWMPGSTYSGELPVLNDRQTAIRDELRGHVIQLAEVIGERNLLHYAAYQDATEYIESKFTDIGYETKHDDFRADGMDCLNIEAEIKGSGSSPEIVVVGAHYDSVYGSPGADDNATGVAALLYLARLFRTSQPDRTLRFVAFANEEPPFFQTAQMGSLVYAQRCRDKGLKIVAMIAFDGLGFYDDHPGSQSYPFPINLFYPSTGNFVGFVGNPASRKLLREAIATFRTHAIFPSEGAVLPEFIPGAGWSDQWSFWKQDYPAILITDTLPFRYSYYHLPEDTPDKIEFDHLARVVDGLEAVIAYLIEVPLSPVAKNS